MENKDQKTETELGTLMPMNVEFELGGKELTFGKWTMRVDLWIEQRFGENRQEFMSSLNTEKLGKLAYRLLDEESRRKLNMIKRKETDDEGKLVDVTIPGWERLMELIATSQDVETLQQAIFRCMGMSSALINQVLSETKKKTRVETKKEKSSAGES